MYPLPVSILPILRCLHCFVVGIPINLANFCFAELTPRARFQENEKSYGFLLPIISFLFKNQTWGQKT
jgi:hypothetical protein